ncbi:phosphoribosyltransferase [Pleurocapsales cyanobacterium LEGE 10410]|nr:phosphoribosyltransferase [Pleurocapsales cyanobacterium LEGE 10410]
MNAVFSNRRDAGRRLAQQLTSYFNHPQAIVLGLSRGGVPVAYEIAKVLHLPLDVCLVKKIGLPDAPEKTVGAIAEDALVHDYSGKITIIDENITQKSVLELAQIQAIAARVKADLRWRECCYRHYRPLLKIAGSVVIIVDDGIATGLTMHAAITALQRHQPQKLILAVPVAPEETLQQFETLTDDITCLITPQSLGAVGFWYEDFDRVSDRQVCDLLSRETRLVLSH